MAKRRGELEIFEEVGRFRETIRELREAVKKGDEEVKKRYHEQAIINASSLIQAFKKDAQAGLPKERITAISNEIYRRILPALDTFEPVSKKVQPMGHLLKEGERVRAFPSMTTTRSIGAQPRVHLLRESRRTRASASVAITKPRLGDWFFIDHQIHLEAELQNVNITREFKYYWVFSRGETLPRDFSIDKPREGIDKVFPATLSSTVLRHVVNASELGQGAFYVFAWMSALVRTMKGVQIHIIKRRIRMLGAGAVNVPTIPAPESKATPANPKFNFKVGVAYADPEKRTPFNYNDPFMRREGWFFAGFYTDKSGFGPSEKNLEKFIYYFQESLAKSKKIEAAFNESYQRAYQLIESEIDDGTAIASVFAAGGVLAIAKAGRCPILVCTNDELVYYTTFEKEGEEFPPKPLVRKFPLAELARKGTIRIIIFDGPLIYHPYMQSYDEIAEIVASHEDAKDSAEAVIEPVRKLPEKLAWGTVMVIKITPKDGALKRSAGKPAGGEPKVEIRDQKVQAALQSLNADDEQTRRVLEILGRK